MDKRDYYQTLGVARDANDAEIKRAFRKLAMKHHPDRNTGDKGAEEKFKEIKEAYDVLSDSQKRAAYDRFGHAGVNSAAGGFGGGGAGSGAGPGGFADMFGDIFGDIFGNAGGGARGPQSGSDLRYNMELNLEDVVGGTTVEVQIPSAKVCQSCHGTGGRSGKQPATCSRCNGAGQIRMQQGFFAVQQTCPLCRGRGAVITDPCHTCNGHGRVEETKKLSVKIPAGIDEGDRIRLSGEGDLGEPGARPGDLYVQIHVRPHPIFKRDGKHLHCEIPISFVTATLGGEIEVPTLDGRVKLKIPEGTQSGKMFRLRGKGVKPLREASPGDLFCKAALETPVNLNRKQKDLLKEFGELIEKEDGKHSPQAKSWFSRVKQFFEDVKPS